jgi:dihydrofolate reductase
VSDFISPEQEQYKLEEALEAESHLLGRITYESFAGAWPKRSGEFADKLNSMPKYVVSSTLSDPLEWNNSTLIQGDIAAEVATLKERDGGPILVAGSCTLVQSLVENDLVDELRLMVFPVIVGGGKRLFPESRQKKSFKLTGSQAFNSGVAVNTYEPA